MFEVTFSRFGGCGRDVETFNAWTMGQALEEIARREREQPGHYGRNIEIHYENVEYEGG
jgi:hypothetical protein